MNSETTHAQTVAQAVYEVAHPLSIFLFGSRARGDHHTESDIDLLMVSDEPCDAITYGKAALAGNAQIKRVYGRALALDLVNMSRTKFKRFSWTRNHLAGKTRHEGVLVAGKDILDDNDRIIIDNWPDVQQRMRIARSALNTMPDILANAEAERWYGFLGQQALENGLKAYISALDLPYDKTHDLSDLIETVLDHEWENTVELPPTEWVQWLNKYAVTFRYGEVEKGIEDRPGFLEEIKGIVENIGKRILEITGREAFESESDETEASAEDEK